MIALISLAAVSSIMLFEVYGTSSLTSGLIRHAAETEADLAYMGIEKPMVVGDNKATMAEFAAIKSKFTDITAYMTSFMGDITYSTEPGLERKDFSSVLQGDNLVITSYSIHYTKLYESLWISCDGRTSNCLSALHGKCSII